MRLPLIGFCSFLVLAGKCFAQDCTTPAISESNNKFGFDMYRALLQKKGTVFFSPYSIFSALQMTADGAKGTTSTEMLQTLYSKDNLACIQSDINKSLERYRNLLSTGDSIYVANSLWVQTSFPLDTSFVNHVKDIYEARVDEVDFIKKTEAARKTINEWVEEQSNKRIKDLLGPGMLNTDTKLVLVNTIMFKAKWTNPFDPGNTRNEIFHTAENDLKVPFMHDTRAVSYAEDETMQAIELPYQSEKIAMLVLLPVQGNETEFEKKLDAVQLTKWIGDMKMQRTTISLPKFKMNSSFNLNDMLIRSGMKTAFSDAADFSGIRKGGGLRISDVIHSAFIEVGEDGTEAAAATAVTVMTRSIAQLQPDVKIFRADRPFIFLLYDKEAKTILFMGKMDDPK